MNLELYLWQQTPDITSDTDSCVPDPLWVKSDRNPCETALFWSDYLTPTSAQAAVE